MLTACGTFTDLESIDGKIDDGRDGADAGASDLPADSVNPDVPDLDTGEDAAEGDVVEDAVPDAIDVADVEDDQADVEADQGDVGDAGVAVTAVFAGPVANHSCASFSDGTQWCWGDNLAGQIGDGSRVLSTATPSRVNLPLTGRVVAGSRHACAETETGIYCWGDNNQGKLGPAATGEHVSSPTLVSGLEAVVAIAAGRSHTCALTELGQVHCWGDNSDGQLGAGLASDFESAPVHVSSLCDVRQIAADC